MKIKETHKVDQFDHENMKMRPRGYRPLPGEQVTWKGPDENMQVRRVLHVTDKDQAWFSPTTWMPVQELRPLR